MAINDLVIYTDKIRALFELSLFFFFLTIPMVIVLGYGIFKPIKATTKRMQLKRVIALIMAVLLLMLSIDLSFTNLKLLFQRSPELIINNKGIKLHTLGFLPWTEIDHIKIKASHGRGSTNDLLKIILKSDSTWRPKNSSYSDTSIFSDKSITIKNVLDVNVYDLRDKLRQISPSIKIIAR